MPELNVWAAPAGDQWQVMVSMRYPSAWTPPGVMAYAQSPLGSPMTAHEVLPLLRRLTARWSS